VCLTAARRPLCSCSDCSFVFKVPCKVDGIDRQSMTHAVRSREGHDVGVASNADSSGMTGPRCLAPMPAGGCAHGEQAPTTAGRSREVMTVGAVRPATTTAAKTSRASSL
jgi:hypothetical protein